MSGIPIRNIYYMILYAFDKVKHLDQIEDKSFENVSIASEVMVELFLNEVGNICRKGIYRDYNRVTEESLFIKGKLDIKSTILKSKSTSTIIYDDFNGNNDINKIIKYTLNRIIFSNVKQEFKNRAKLYYSYFNKVDLIELSDDIYRTCLLNRINSNYEFAIKLSVYINKKIIPDNHKGKLKFYDILDDEETMSTIYEQFLRNFYKIHTDYDVSRKNYNWFLKPLEGSDYSLLPKMETDIEIEINKDYKIIIDAKYYKEALNSRYSAKKFASNNIYQMNTYLVHNLRYNKLRGILLYPCVTEEFHQYFEKKNSYTIEFHTIDLSQRWNEISQNLISIV